MNKKLYYPFIIGVILFFNCMKKPLVRESLPGAEELKVYNEMLMAGDYSSAQQGYETFIVRYPDSPLIEDALYGMARLHLLSGRYDKARDFYKEVLKRFPGGYYRRESNTGLAIIDIRLGDFHSAKELLKGLLSYEKVNRAQIEYLLGETHYFLHDYFDALLHFREAWRLFSSPVLRENAAHVIRELLIPELDREELIKLSSYFPKDFPGGEIHLRLAREYMETGNRLEAKRSAEMVLEYFSEPELINNAGRIVEMFERQELVEQNIIGLLLPLSGEFGEFGERVLKGVLLATGFLSTEERMRYSLVLEDTRGIPKMASEGVEDLVERFHVAGIIGPILPGTSQISAVRAQVYGVPIILLGNRDNLQKIGSYVLSFGITNRAQASAIARYALNELKLKKFAILYPKIPYGETQMNAFWDEVNKNGGEVLGIENYEAGKKQFTEEIKKLVGIFYLDTRKEEKEKWIELMRAMKKAPRDRDWKPPPVVDFDALFIPDTYDIVSIILLYLPYYDIIGVQKLGTNGWNRSEILSLARRESEGSIFLDAFSADSSRPEVRYFVETFRLMYNETPDLYSALGYDAARLLLRAIDEGGGDRERIMKNLLLVRNFSGATGQIDISQDGSTIRDFIILEIRNGKINVLREDYR